MSVKTTEQPYSEAFGNDEKYYVDGPGQGLSYSSGTLWPELRCENPVEAIRAAKIANIAFAGGVKSAQRAIRKSLGMS